MRYEAVVVGAGPNGLAAAIEMARAGRKTLLLEAEQTVGGAARTAELTLPGFRHDLGAAVLPLAVASPFMRTLPLEKFGVEWIRPPLAVAHPLDGGTAAVLGGTVEETAATLGADEKRYLRLIAPLARNWPEMAPVLLAPPRPPIHPLKLVRFALLGILPSALLIRRAFQGEPARALMAGFAAHSVRPLDEMGTSSFALLFAATGHTTGWPFPRGGAQSVSDAMAGYLRSLGAEIQTDLRVSSLRDIPSAATILLDLSPRQLLAIAGDRLGDRSRRRLSRLQPGPGVYKVDYALSASVPWQAAEIARAGTVHVGGTLAEVVAAEAVVARGGHPEHPFVLVAQPSRFDRSRAPEGMHTLWAYTHVPNGSTADMTARIDAQIERFAPGFRDVVLSRHVMAPEDLERMDANLVGGDITGGPQTLRRMVARPLFMRNPYATPIPRVYLCSASTPPGGGVHGMCGYWAARFALTEVGER